MEAEESPKEPECNKQEKTAWTSLSMAVPAAVYYSSAVVLTCWN
jgi:hypothetical protein